MPDQDFAKNISDQLDELNGSINRLINLFNNQADKLENGIKSINRIEKSSEETQRLVGKSLDNDRQQINSWKEYNRELELHENERIKKITDKVNEASKEVKELTYGVREYAKEGLAHDAMANERNARIDELAKAREQRERAEYIATELWRSTLVSSIRDIIDNQVKAMTEMGKARGLDREETVALYQSVNTIRKDLNKNGGYIFSNEQVRIAFEALAPTDKVALVLL